MDRHYLRTKQGHRKTPAIQLDEFEAGSRAGESVAFDNVVVNRGCETPESPGLESANPSIAAFSDSLSGFYPLSEFMVKDISTHSAFNLHDITIDDLADHKLHRLRSEIKLLSWDLYSILGRSGNKSCKPYHSPSPWLANAVTMCTDHASCTAVSALIYIGYKQNTALLRLCLTYGSIANAFTSLSDTTFDWMF